MKKQEIRNFFKYNIDREIYSFRNNYLRLKDLKKSTDDLIKFYEKYGEDVFRKTYINCHYNLAELKYRKKSISKVYKKAKAEHDEFIKNFKLKMI